MIILVQSEDTPSTSDIVMTYFGKIFRFKLERVIYHEVFLLFSFGGSVTYILHSTAAVRCVILSNNCVRKLKIWKFEWNV